MAKRREVAVWLHDDWGRAIVGALPAATRSRWVLQGAIVEQVEVGVWVQADTVQEFRRLARGKGGKQVNWMFKSSQLLIPWNAIITIQAFDGDVKEIGFKPSPEE